MHWASAQKHVCGISHEDQEVLAQQVHEYNVKVANGWLQKRSAETRYIPVAFHRVGQNDGSGRIDIRNILNQLARLNRDFEDTGFRFYFDQFDFREINSNAMYEDPGSVSGQVRARKASDALNIFVTDAAPTGNQLGGTTLGYYSGGDNDFVVMIKQELLDTSNTLSHELGHFFSLPHTHRGWDNEDYDENVHGNPLNSPLSPGGVLVEKADGSNCDIAGDLICDTPSDFNFGFGAQNCIWNAASKNVRDHCNMIVDPMEENQMGYFLSCSKYAFTPMQMDIMHDDLDSPRRSYLRSSFVPVTDELVGLAEMTTPEDRSTLEYYDNVLVDWNDVPGATHYLVEAFNNQEGFNEEIIVSESQLIFPLLPQKATIRLRIYPFNQGNTEFESPVLYRFTTGDRLTNTSEIEGLDQLSVYPNPSKLGQEIQISLTAQERMEEE